jgi:hypothetical protein
MANETEHSIVFAAHSFDITEVENLRPTIFYGLPPTFWVAFAK